MKKRLSQSVAFSAAILAPVFIAIAVVLSWPVFDAIAASIFLLAVMFCAWLGGLSPGLLSLLISLAMARYFFIQPYHSFSSLGLSADDSVRLLTVGVIGVFVSFASELMHRARRRTEESIETARKGEERFRNTLDSLIEGCQIIDRDWRYLYVNTAAAKQGGETVERLLGRTIMEAFPGIDQTELFGAFRQSMEDRVPRQIENEFTRPDGVSAWFQVVIRPVPEGLFILSADITERKRYDEAIRASEKRYRFLFENNPYPMWVFDIETLKFLAVNEAATYYYGYSRKEFMEMTILDIRPPEYRDAVVETVAKSHETIRSAGIWKHLKRNGTVIDVEITSHNISFDGRQARLVLSNDVTERKRNEEEILARQAQLSGMIESAMDAIISVDKNQQILLFNSAAEKMFRCSAEEAIGQSLECFIPERFRAAHSYYIQSFGDTGVTTRAMAGARTVYGQRSDGEEFPIEASISQVEVGGQKIYTVILRDLTERQRAEEKLSLFAAIVESSDAAIISKNLDGIILSWNPAAEQLYGYTAAEAIGRPVTMLIPPDRLDEEPQIIERIKRDERVNYYETKRRRKDGSLIDVSLTVSPVKDAQGQIVGASKIARDITEQKHAQEEVRRLNEELEQRVFDRTAQLQAANKELEAFSYSVSHDLRAPLRHINGFSLALLEDYENMLDEGGKAYLHEIRGASHDMGQLIDDMLELARVTRSEMKRENVDLSKLASEIAKKISETDLNRNVPFTIEDGLMANCDKSLMRIVLANLFENSWKFTSKTEHAEIVFGKEITSNETLYFVRDNGAGFDMAYADKLFGAFQRLHSASSFDGTGIGLSTVQRIIHRHGGEVRAEGKVDHGATFYFTLPDVKGEDR